MGLKSQPKLSRHGEERLVKISDQNTQGVRRSKSQTEGEQNWFSVKCPKFSGDSYMEFQEKTISEEFFINFLQTKAILYRNL